MMNDFFELLKQYLLKDDEIKNKIQMYALFDLPNDPSYPLILLTNKNEIQNNNVYENKMSASLSCILTLFDNSYDESQFFKLHDVLHGLLKALILENSIIQIVCNCNNVISIKQSEIYRADFNLNVKIFFK